MTQEKTQTNINRTVIADALVQQFGALMTSTEVRAALKFKSVSAFAMARKRGHLQLEPRRIQGRRAHMFATDEVAQLMSEWMAVPSTASPTGKSA